MLYLDTSLLVTASTNEAETARSRAGSYGVTVTGVTVTVYSSLQQPLLPIENYGDSSLNAVTAMRRAVRWPAPLGVLARARGRQRAPEPAFD
jgi:hypothetical protein